MEQYGKTRQIQNLSHEVALHHMITALWPKAFADKLYMKLAEDMDKLR